MNPMNSRGCEQTEPTAYLGLGSNLGDRLANLRRAVNLLSSDDTVTLRCSAGLYETSPVGGPDKQSNYYNSVVSIQTSLAPSSLLTRMLDLESELGRRRAEINDPRTIDIDLLLYGETLCESPELTLPHPRMHTRRFVLTPLVDIAPQLVHPRLHVTMSELLTDLPPNGETVEQVYAPDWVSD